MARRTLALPLGALVVLLSMATASSTAWAGPPAHFAGDAPGAATCSVKATITYAATVAVKGKVSACRTLNGGGATVSITSGTLSGTFSEVPYLCFIVCGGSDASSALSVTWKGSLGAVGAYGGTAHFSSSSIADAGSTAFVGPSGDIGIYVPGADNESTVSGSFASDGSYLDLATTYTPAHFAAAQASRAGIKKIAVTGTLTLRDMVAYVAGTFGTNPGDNTVTPIDTSTNTAGPSIPVGSSGDPSDSVAVTPDGATAYVTNSANDTVTPIDTFTDTAGPAIPVGVDPDAIAIAPNGATAYVVNAGGSITPIDTSTNATAPPIPVEGFPESIAITPDGANLYVGTNTGATNWVLPISTSTDATGPAIPVGAEPDDIAITPDGSTAYVVNSDDGTLTPIDLSTDAPGPAVTITCGGCFLNDVAIAPNGSTAYVTDGYWGTVTPVDTSTDEPGTAFSTAGERTVSPSPRMV